MMIHMCHFCRREKAESECSTCRRWVCIQCSSNHNCYQRRAIPYRAAPIVASRFVRYLFRA